MSLYQWCPTLSLFATCGDWQFRNEFLIINKPYFSQILQFTIQSSDRKALISTFLVIECCKNAFFHLISEKVDHKTEQTLPRFIECHRQAWNSAERGQAGGCHFKSWRYLFKTGIAPVSWGRQQIYINVKESKKNFEKVWKSMKKYKKLW